MAEDTKMATIWARLSAIDVSPHTKNRQGYTYLPWGNAHALMMEHYPDYEVEYPEPTVYPDGSVELHCTVRIDGRARRESLPVMDPRNNAIKNPNARDYNDTRKRLMVKTLAQFGLGEALYRGEIDNTPSASETAAAMAKGADDMAKRFAAYGEALRRYWHDVTLFREHAAAYLADEQEHHLQAAVEVYLDGGEEFQRVLQMAPSKGGPLEVAQRNLIKSNEFSRLKRATMEVAA